MARGWSPLAFVASAAVLLAPAAAVYADRYWGLALPARGWALAWALLAAPVVEEWIFRSLQEEVARWLRACRPAIVSAATGCTNADLAAAAVATVVFVAAHAGHVAGTPLRLVAWVAPAVALALLWTWRRSRLACIALHAYFNGCLWLAGAL